MRLPRPRFTVWRLMIAVAVLALLFGLGVEYVKAIRVRPDYQRWAAQYARWEEADRSFLRNADPVTSRLGDSPEGVRFREIKPEEVEMIRREADEYARRRRKWERAAAYPWLPVEPDPPEPK